MRYRIAILFGLGTLLAFAATGPAQVISYLPREGSSPFVNQLQSGLLHEAMLIPSRPEEPPPPASAGGPPAPLAESPGTGKHPKGAFWIPGYWEWDGEYKEYTWISGCWRVPPPGRSWVAGRWEKRDDGTWVHRQGFWADVKSDRNVPKSAGPPEGVEPPEDEPGELPGPGRFLLHGHYEPAPGGAIWKHAFWARGQEGWEWEPVAWLDRGDHWIYRAGYWDYSLDGRGLMYLPAHLARSQRGESNVAFRPWATIDPGMFNRIATTTGRISRIDDTTLWNLVRRPRGRASASLLLAPYGFGYGNNASQMIVQEAQARAAAGMHAGGAFTMPGSSYNSPQFGQSYYIGNSNPGAAYANYGLNLGYGTANSYGVANSNPGATYGSYLPGSPTGVSGTYIGNTNPGSTYPSLFPGSTGGAGGNAFPNSIGGLGTGVSPIPGIGP